MKKTLNSTLLLVFSLVASLFLMMEPIYGGQSVQQDIAGAPISEERLPAPKQGYGHAKGILFHKGEAKDRLPIYLVIHSEKGEVVEVVATPKTYTDNKGHWVILDLKPGVYSVRPNIPKGTFFIREKNIFKIIAGKTIDFGVQDFSGTLDGK